MARKRHYAVFRSDDAPRGSHGWMVNFVRKGRAYTRFFADRKWGGRQRALEAAIAHRDEIDRTVPRPTRAEINDKLRRNNTSGIVGVCRCTEHLRSGNEKVSWVATWVTELGGRTKSRSFAVSRYGEARAKALAIEARRGGMEGLQTQTHVKSRTGRRSLPPRPPKPETKRIDAFLVPDLVRWLDERALQRAIRRTDLIAQILEAARKDSKRSKRR